MKYWLRLCSLCKIHQNKLNNSPVRIWVESSTEIIRKYLPPTNSVWNPWKLLRISVPIWIYKIEKTDRLVLNVPKVDSQIPPPWMTKWYCPLSIWKRNCLKILPTYISKQKYRSKDKPVNLNTLMLLFLLWKSILPNPWRPLSPSSRIFRKKVFNQQNSFLTYHPCALDAVLLREFRFCSRSPIPHFWTTQLCVGTLGTAKSVPCMWCAFE